MRGGKAGSRSASGQSSAASASARSASAISSTRGSTLVSVARSVPPSSTTSTGTTPARVANTSSRPDPLGERDGGRDGRVPAERHLGLGTEVTDAVRPPLLTTEPVRRRGQKRGLRVPELGCDRQHGAVVKGVRVQDDTRGVAAVGVAGEGGVSQHLGPRRVRRHTRGNVGRVAPIPGGERGGRERRRRHLPRPRRRPQHPPRRPGLRRPPGLHASRAGTAAPRGTSPPLLRRALRHLPPEVPHTFSMNRRADTSRPEAATTSLREHHTLHIEEVRR